MFKATQPVLEFMKKHDILATSYCGLVPLTKCPGGPVDPVLTAIRERLERDTGTQVTAGQVLGLWLRYQGIPQITSVNEVAQSTRGFLTHRGIPQDKLEARARQGVYRH